jgi:2,3-bisphosphoglycerate-independent phosphoglycerate mutase
LVFVRLLIIIKEIIMKNKVMLVIMDGWGLSPEERGNAPMLAKTPILDYIYSTYPKTSLSASGLEVGLSAGEPGNSEVGHLSIGSGRVVWENLPRIDQAIRSGELFESPTLKNVLDEVKKKKSALHLIGLVSDGGVHSHIRHLISLLEYAKRGGVSDVYIHAILDGRDTAPKEAEMFLKQLSEATAKYGGVIVDLVGRYFAMDRDKNWDREKKAYDLFVKNIGDRYPTFEDAIAANYKKGKSDEFFEPSVIGDGKTINPGDGVIFFNHRSDRMKQMLSLFNGFDGIAVPSNLTLATMTEYDNNQKTPAIFAPVNLKNTLCTMISDAGLRQFHTAETEKYAHVTYFLKAGREEILKGETDKLVPSKKVSYDEVPEMSAVEVTGVVKKALEDDFDFIVVNYANGDMVGHTGNLESAVKACEVVDECLGEIMTSASGFGYKVFLTADHGNCEVMIDELTKRPDKEHTTNPVPFVILDLVKAPFAPKALEIKREDYIQYASSTPVGVLADIAPSILANLGINKPDEMTGMDLSVAMM